MPTAALATAGSVLTATEYNYLPRGLVTQAAVTANQGSITTIVDVTSMSVSVPQVAGRKYLIVVHATLFSSANNDAADVRLTDGSNNVLATASYTLGTATYFETGSIVYYEAASSTATVTRKLRCIRTAGTGNITFAASSTQPAQIIVLDIGT